MTDESLFTCSAARENSPLRADGHKSGNDGPPPAYESGPAVMRPGHANDMNVYVVHQPCAKHARMYAEREARRAARTTPPPATLTEVRPPTKTLPNAKETPMEKPIDYDRENKGQDESCAVNKTVSKEGTRNIVPQATGCAPEAVKEDWVEEDKPHRVDKISPKGEEDTQNARKSETQNVAVKNQNQTHKTPAEDEYKHKYAGFGHILALRGDEFQNTYKGRCSGTRCSGTAAAETDKLSRKVARIADSFITHCSKIIMVWFLFNIIWLLYFHN